MALQQLRRVHRLARLQPALPRSAARLVTLAQLGQVHRLAEAANAVASIGGEAGGAAAAQAGPPPGEAAAGAASIGGAAGDAGAARLVPPPGQGCRQLRLDRRCSWWRWRSLQFASEVRSPLEPPPLQDAGILWRQRCYFSPAIAAAVADPQSTVSTASGMQHPSARPSFLCRPDLVSGTPMAREILPLAAERPEALRHENDKPGIPRRRRVIRRPCRPASVTAEDPWHFVVLSMPSPSEM